MLRIRWAITAALLGMCVSASVAQTAATDNFAKVIRNPTGQNGYEDFVKAGDILLNAGAWQEFERPAGDAPPTLAMKRRLVADPAVRAALDMLRAGVRKQVRSPRERLDDETPLPELSAFRALARALGHQIYVQLAEGRVSQAIDSLTTALKFGYLVQVDTLIAGLVAITVDAIALKPIGDHLDQLSVHDCDRLIAMAKEWLQLPDPALALLQSDKRLSLEVFSKYKADPVKLLKILDPGAMSPESKKRQEELEQQFTANPNSAIGVYDQAAQMLSGQYDHAIASLGRPAWERKPFAPVDASTPAGFLATEFGGAPVLLRVLDRYAREQAQVQMLGVHAAIRKHLWEFNSLPESLAALKLGAMILDPFSGRSFDYKRLEGNRYALSSIGPLDRESKPGSADQRQPITFGSR